MNEKTRKADYRAQLAASGIATTSVRVPRELREVILIIAARLRDGQSFSWDAESPETLATITPNSAIRQKVPPGAIPQCGEAHTPPADDEETLLIPTPLFWLAMIPVALLFAGVAAGITHLLKIYSAQ